ncbi:MAG TPA: rhomboid family intramembrane serine protease [Actinomycetota bacterium]|nr:rhomboid family intramembrane serine protease [Actinomycetota bacterium]
MAAEPEVCYRHPDQETRVHCTRCGRPICPDCMTAAPVGHHCPTCVAEGRRGQRRIRGAIPRPRSVTTVILGINVVVFAVELALGGASGEVLIRLGAMVPFLVATGEYWRLITAMFLHVGILHLLLNSWGLFLFGNLIEGVFGSARFLAIYLVTGFCASAASFAFGGPNRVAAGASGAIFGLLGAWLAYNWRRRGLFLAQANLRGAMLLIALNLFLGFQIAGIDNTAHIGGLVAGVLAGLAAEGVGARGVRTATRLAGLTLLLLAGVAVAGWRVAVLTG